MMLRKILGNLILRNFLGKESRPTPLRRNLAHAWIRVEQWLFRPLTLPMQDSISLSKR